MESAPLLVIIGAVAVGAAGLAGFFWNRFDKLRKDTADGMAELRKELLDKVGHDRRNLQQRDVELEQNHNQLDRFVAKMDKDYSLRLQRLENGTTKHGP